MISTFKQVGCSKNSFQNLKGFSQLVFWKIHMFVQLSRRGLFGGNKTNLWLETLKRQEVFLSKTN
jgi:hypothetical protein